MYQRFCQNFFQAESSLLAGTRPCCPVTLSIDDNNNTRDRRVSRHRANQRFSWGYERRQPFTPSARLPRLFPSTAEKKGVWYAASAPWGEPLPTLESEGVIQRETISQPPPKRISPAMYVVTERGKESCKRMKPGSRFKISMVLETYLLGRD